MAATSRKNQIENYSVDRSARCRYTSTRGHDLARRIHVVGSSCSGKSTLAERLSRILQIPVVDLDALNWMPGWVPLHQQDPKELDRRIMEATRGDSWVVAGNYLRFSRRLLWDRVGTVVWLDFPLPLLVLRLLVRSWKRWRTKELLWGTNYERFWPQLMVWRKEESLVWWVVSQYRRQKRTMLLNMRDPRYRDIQFIRLRNPTDVRAFVRNVACSTGRMR